MPPFEITEAELATKIAEAVATEVKALKDKNFELIGKLKTIQEKADEEAAAKIALEKKAEEDRLSAEGKHEEVLKMVRTNLEAEVTKWKEKAEVATKASEEDRKNLRVLMVDNELSKRFLEVGVTNPDLLEAATALVAPRAEIVEGEGGPSVKIGTQDMDAFFKDWKEGKGKAFITNGNTGGGGDGGEGGGGDDWEQYFKPGATFSQSKQVELQKADINRYNEMRKKYPLATETPMNQPAW